MFFFIESFPYWRRKKQGEGEEGNQVTKSSFKICDTWKIFNSNIRGYDSKAISLKGIINNIKANVVTLNETNLKGNRKLKIDGFTSYTSHRQKAHMGGIATSIDNKDAPNSLKVNEGADDDDEFMVI